MTYAAYKCDKCDLKIKVWFEDIGQKYSTIVQ